MTHQVIYLSEALRPDAAEAVPYSAGTRDAAAAQSGRPVALTVALRYLAGRRAFSRTPGIGPKRHD